MAFILDPHASANAAAAENDRFVSMSVTRNPSAVVSEPSRPFSVRQTMRLDDIEGSRPKSHTFSRSNFHDTQDIEGAQPKVLHAEKRNHPALALTNHDIEESMPRANRFRTTRSVDPVDPRYNLATVEAPPPAEAPFKRDLHNISDIAGSSSSTYLPWKSRESMKIDDIAGTHARARTQIVQGIQSYDAHADSMQVRDINEDGLKPVGFRSKRRTDEMLPKYLVHGRVVYDDDNGMFVKGEPRGAGTRPFLPLVTEDIEGARAGRSSEVTVGGIPADKRRYWQVTNNISDIPGAQAMTRYHGLTSVRMTDPNERDYVLLDGRRWNAEELAIGKSWYNAAATILAAESAEMAATMPYGKTGIAAAVAPLHNYTKKILDPRDAELARMRGELETLRREREVVTLSNKLASIRVAKEAKETSTERVSTNAGVYDTISDRITTAHVSNVSSNQEPHSAPSSAAASSEFASTVALSSVPSSSSFSSSSSSVTKGLGPRQKQPSYESDSKASMKKDYAKHIEHDPIETLRSRLADINSRNILGVIPATRPPQDLTGKQATIRQTTGRYDSRLDTHPAAPRGTNPFAVRSGQHMVSGAYHDSHEYKRSIRERQRDVADRKAPNDVRAHSHEFDPVDAKTRAIAQGIIDEVRSGGETALRSIAAKFGDLASPDARLVLDREAMKIAYDEIPKDQQMLLERVAARIRVFAEAQRAALTNIDVTVPGGRAGHTVSPCATAGCYAPGGRYPLPSSVLMTAITARVAGVETVWVASPRPLPITIAAAYVSGADALLCVGGAQAIAALAFGIGGPPNCDVIVGPGNRFVTAAKSIVSGHCAIDMLAGPSECLVLADETADAHLIAADLLAQAEHDTDALPILVTTSANLADRVDEEMGKQLAVLPTAAVASVSAAKGFTVLCSTLDEAISVVDKLAPEHLEVQVADSDFVWKRVKNYGGMFVGANTAEVFGDYGAGPNHVLPTSGTARYTGGLSVFTFLRVRTWLRSDAPVIDRAGLDAVARDSAHLARLEGLFGHEAAALARGSEEVKEEARLAKKN